MLIFYSKIISFHLLKYSSGCQDFKLFYFIFLPFNLYQLLFIHYYAFNFSILIFLIFVSKYKFFLLIILLGKIMSFLDFLLLFPSHIKCTLLSTQCLINLQWNMTHIRLSQLKAINYTLNCHKLIFFFFPFPFFFLFYFHS